VGIRRKLAGYSLDLTSEIGGPKARGFEQILGIALDDIDYLEGAIQTGIFMAPVTAVRDNSPFGVNCVVAIPVRGRQERRARVVGVRTVWEIAENDSRPRLVSAFARP
jgi:hypothetical protein